MADKKSKFSIVIGAVDDISMQVMEINQRINKALEPIKKLNQAVGLLGSELGVGKFGAALSNVKSKFGDVFSEAGKVALALGGAGVAFGYLVKSTADYADNIRDVAYNTGVGTDAIQAFRFMAANSGLEVEQTDKIISKFSTTLGKAKTEGGEAADVLSALGVDMNAVRNGTLKLNDVLPIVAKSLTKIQDTDLRNVALTELFGKGGREAAGFMKELADNGGNLNDIIDKLKSQGLIIDKGALDAADNFNDTLNTLVTTFNALKASAVAELFPALTDLLKEVQALLVNNSGAIKEWAQQFAKDLPSRIETLKNVFSGLWSVVEILVGAFKGLSSIIGESNAVILLLSVTIAAKLIVSLVTLGGALTTVATTGIPMMIKIAGVMYTQFMTLASFAIPAVTAAMGWLSAAFTSLGVAIMATPIGWIMAAIALLAGAAYLIYANWEPISEFFSNLWDGIVESFDTAIKYITGVINSIKSGLGFSVTADVNPENKVAAGPSLNAATVAQNASPFKASQPAENSLKVTFDNLPAGARVTPEKSDNPMEMIMQGVPMSPGTF